MMKNRFQNDRSRVKMKICDVDLPMVTDRHTGFHKFSHLIEQSSENGSSSEVDVENESSWTSFIKSIWVDIGSENDCTV